MHANMSRVACVFASSAVLCLHDELLGGAVVSAIQVLRQLHYQSHLILQELVGCVDGLEILGLCFVSILCFE